MFAAIGLVVLLLMVFGGFAITGGRPTAAWLGKIQPQLASRMDSVNLPACSQRQLPGLAHASCRVALPDTRPADVCHTNRPEP